MARDRMLWNRLQQIPTLARPEGQCSVTCRVNARVSQVRLSTSRDDMVTES